MARRISLQRPRPLELGRRLVDLLGPTGDAARQSLVALVFNSSTSLVAGALLGAIVTTFEELPGLLVMVPAAIGLRGNIFGAVGNRISTAIHTGTFRLSTKRESVLTQNVLASLALTVVLSFALAFIAKVVSVGFGVTGTIPVLDLVLISIAQVLGMSADDVFQAYVKKNEVNFKRQETGYATKDHDDSKHI